MYYMYFYIAISSRCLGKKAKSTKKAYGLYNYIGPSICGDPHQRTPLSYKATFCV